ncbi:MAG: carboxypeptidase regulatory-like domain-containing protein [Pyrinomonadaceae bacterium]|nr:carboxypeptidase regulatory-like domain-containing protein [Pyrinomonadaceae bacterium]
MFRSIQKTLISLCAAILLCVPGTVLAGGIPTSFVVLNEIQVNNPGADLPHCEHIEIRGDANSQIPANTYVLEIEGDGSGAGIVDFSINLGFFPFGSNGIRVVTGPGGAPTFKENIGVLGPCGSRNYSGTGAAVTEAGSLTLENGTISFLLVNSASVISAGLDIDLNNDGVIDNLPIGATIIDAVGWTDGSIGDHVYGGVNITPGTGTPDAASRNFANITPLDPTAWFADDIVGTTESVLYDQTNFGGFMIDFLTPGAQNLAPLAAGVFVQGRVIDAKGRGLKRVGVVLTGGLLDEPIIAMTNQFGTFKFEGVTAGETYLLQVMSGRFSFDTPVQALNVAGNVADVVFIGEQR